MSKQILAKQFLFQNRYSFSDDKETEIVITKIFHVPNIQ